MGKAVELEAKPKRPTCLGIEIPRQVGHETRAALTVGAGYSSADEQTDETENLS